MSENNYDGPIYEGKGNASVEAVFASSHYRGGEALYRALFRTEGRIATLLEVGDELREHTFSATDADGSVTEMLSIAVSEINTKLKKIDAGEVVPFNDAANTTCGYMFVSEPGEKEIQYEALKNKILTYARERTADGTVGFHVGDYTIFRFYPENETIQYPQLWGYLKRGETLEEDTLFFSRSEYTAVLFARLLQTQVITRLDRQQFIEKYNPTTKMKSIVAALNLWLQRHNLPHAVHEFDKNYVLTNDDDTTEDIRQRVQNVLSEQIIAQVMSETETSPPWEKIGRYQVAFFDYQTDPNYPVYAMLVQPLDGEITVHMITNKQQYDFLHYVANRGGYVDESKFEKDKHSGVAPSSTYKSLAYASETLSKRRGSPQFDGVVSTGGYVLLGDIGFRNYALNDRANTVGERIEYTMIDENKEELQTLSVIDASAITDMELKHRTVKLLQIRKGVHQVTVELTPEQYNDVHEVFLNVEGERTILQSVVWSTRNRGNLQRLFANIHRAATSMHVTVDEGDAKYVSARFPVLVPTHTETVIQEMELEGASIEELQLEAELADLEAEPEFETKAEPERRLILAAREGDQDAWKQLYENTYEKIYRYIFYRVSDEELAKDIAGDVFLEMAEGLDTYTMEAPVLAWAYTIARSRVINHYRSLKRRNPLNLEDIPNYSDHFSTTYDMDEGMMEAFDHEKIREAMNQLTEEQQQVIQLRFFDGKNIKETAAALGITEGTVKIRQHRAVKALGKRLNPDDFPQE